MPFVIEIDDTAPDFELPDQDGNPVSLSDLRGQTLVLYFYPRGRHSRLQTQYRVYPGFGPLSARLAMYLI